jgi:hypothetical protein
MSAPESQFAELESKWSEEVGTLWDQVTAVHHHRAIWREMRAGLLETYRDDEPAFFLAHYARLYSTYQAMAIRRIADPRHESRTISLGGVIEQIRKNPAVLRRDRYIEMYVRGKPADDLAYFRGDATQIYDANFGQGDELRIDLLTEWTRELDESCQAVRAYSTKTIAHIDAELDGLEPVTYDNLDIAIDALSSVFGKVQLLVDGVSVLKFEPTIQGDWKSPLRKPIF